MNDIPYTTPDEDPFNIQPLLQQPRRRRSSLLNRWIKEQQKQTPASDTTSQKPNLPTLPPRITPYLAYPELASDRNVALDEASTVESYDLVEDDDIPSTIFRQLEVPSTPTTTRSRRTSKLLHTPSSFRSFNLSFRSTSPAMTLPQDAHSPRAASRISLFPRGPRHSTDPPSDRSTPHQHNRSSSLSTLNIGGKPSLSVEIPNSSRWRPSVLGHFSTFSASQSSVVPSDTAYTPSRPSVSSGDTYTSTTATTTEYDLPMTPPKLNFMESMRSRSRSPGSVFKSGSGLASSSSVWSQNRGTDATYTSVHGHPIAGSDLVGSTSTLAHRMNTSRIPLAPKPGSRLANSNTDYGDEDDVEDDVDTDKAVTRSSKQPDPTRPHIAYSSGGTRVNFATLSSRQKKKKKLVVIGVRPDDERKFEGVKRWCESFGEVSQITRMPNGDLHVHFRSADVADTVCRLRAQVYIAGVGSVQLSWYTGDKR